MNILGQDCGCETRKEVMGAENWQVDVGIIGGAVIVVILLMIVLK